MNEWINKWTKHNKFAKTLAEIKIKPNKISFKLFVKIIYRPKIILNG